MRVASQQHALRQKSRWDHLQLGRNLLASRETQALEIREGLWDQRAKIPLLVGILQAKTIGNLLLEGVTNRLPDGNKRQLLEANAAHVAIQVELDHQGHG